jgi:Uma2 family endonuclease
MQAILGSAMVSQPVVSLRYRVGRSPEAWELPEGPVPESTAHDAALERICSLLRAWAARTANGARVSRNLAVRWLPDHPRTGIDPDVAVLLPGPADFDDLTSYRVWEPGRPPPVLAIEVVSSGHPYKDYSWVHEGYAAMGALELLVFDPLLLGPKSLGPVALQLWRRDLTGAFERVHFGDTPVYSQVLEAWFLVDGRKLIIADDRAGKRSWPTLEEKAEAEAAQSKAEAAQSKAEAAQSKAEAAQSRAEAERERALRAELEAKLRRLTEPG